MNGVIKIGSTRVNEEDLLYDLTHNASKQHSFNLSEEKQNQVLKELKKLKYGC